jgi:predicted DNA-binding protein
MVPYMISERLEIRIDPERRRKLDEIAAARGVSVSAVVREIIDHVYEDVYRQERLRAAREISQLMIEDVPDIAVLKRQLDRTYESDPLP